jgi:hypothetical protein
MDRVDRPVLADPRSNFTLTIHVDCPRQLDSWMQHGSAPLRTLYSRTLDFIADRTCHE